MYKSIRWTGWFAHCETKMGGLPVSNNARCISPEQLLVDAHWTFRFLFLVKITLIQRSVSTFHLLQRNCSYAFQHGVTKLNVGRFQSEHGYWGASLLRQVHEALFSLKYRYYTAVG